MRYVQLGSTGTRVSEICLGAMNFGGATDEAESRATIAIALDRDINFIDTADVYNGGESERPFRRSTTSFLEGQQCCRDEHWTCGTGPAWRHRRTRLGVRRVGALAEQLFEREPQHGFSSATRKLSHERPLYRRPHCVGRDLDIGVADVRSDDVHNHCPQKVLEIIVKLSSDL